ncbi:hypothetical protein [Streptomyces sp. NPDC059176]|uniref:hypothetical protein n=1 Tax=unclassified Streptomyces TaxID=2593676 RepID=UPI0036A2F249
MPNAPWALFTTPGPGCPLVSREGELPVMVATRCDAYGRYPGEHPWETFVRRLSATCPEYAALWEGGTSCRQVPGQGSSATQRWARGPKCIPVAGRQRDAGVPDRALRAERRGKPPSRGVAFGAPCRDGVRGTRNGKSRPLVGTGSG